MLVEKLQRSDPGYFKQYYRKHKTRLRRKMKDYKLKNNSGIREHNRKKYERERRLWLGPYKEITRAIAVDAENIGRAILDAEGFTDVVAFTQNGIFDWFAKKKGRLCCVDVTTSIRKPVRPQQARMALYFKMRLFILFVKPDLLKYKLVHVPKSYLQKKSIRTKGINIHTLHGFKDMQTDIIRMDVDSSLLPIWKENWLKAQRAVIQHYGYYLKRTIIRASGDPLPWDQRKDVRRHQHFHIWHHILTPQKFTDLQRLELQFMLGSDYGRCWINYLRITERNNPYWDKIFGYIVDRTPLKEPCASCNLRRLLAELAQEEQSDETQE